MLILFYCRRQNFDRLAGQGIQMQMHHLHHLKAAPGWHYRWVRCTGTETEIIGAPINFEVGAPGPRPGPRSFLWSNYWIGTDSDLNRPIYS
jgi:hypothetical protein